MAPTNEMAAALGDALDRHWLESGREVWATPRVREFGSWLREQHLLRQRIDARAPYLLTDPEERELWRQVLAEDPGGEELADPAAAAFSARLARRTLVDYGIPRAALDASPTEETQWLGRGLDLFGRRLAGLDALTTDDLLATFPAPPEPIVWLESPAWRPLPRRWLSRHGRAMLTAVGHPAARAAFCQPESPELELEGIAAWARAQLTARPDFRAWIYLPDLAARRTAVVDVFDAVLAPARLSLTPGADRTAYAISGGSPLADYRPVGFGLRLLELLGGSVPFERFSAALRAPELQGSLADASAAAVLDRELRRRGRSEMPLADWLQLCARIAAERQTPPLGAAQRLETFCAVFRGTPMVQPLGRWVSQWLAAFETAPWAHPERWSSGDYQAVVRFRDLLTGLACSDRVFGTRSRDAALGLLRTAALGTSFQPQTGVPPIWVTGQCVDPWLRYDAIWIAGFTAQGWPPPTRPVALLPLALQRQYGVAGADPAAQLAFAQDMQQRWQQRAAAIVFSAASREAQDAAGISALLPAGSAPLAAMPCVSRPHWHAARAAAPAFEQLADFQAPVLGESERTQGVMTLTSQSLCPFRGFAETRLHALTLERPLPGFNAREQGILVHAALDTLWRRLRDSATLVTVAPEAEQMLIADAVGAAIAAQSERRDPGERWQVRERLRLQALLTQWLELERRRTPFRVEQLESPSVTVQHGGLTFQCRVDRVDRLADGSRAVIDYKTSIMQTDWRGARPRSAQLPVYALANRDGLNAVAYAQVHASDCRFVAETAIAGAFLPQGKATTLDDLPDFTALLGAWEERIGGLATEFAQGCAVVQPQPGACRYCHLSSLCRVAQQEPDDGA